MVDKHVFAFVGKPITVKEDVKVTIDCSPVIDAVADANPSITWYKNGRKLSNNSATNVYISQDKRQCIISNTLLAVGGQIGTGGNYTCEVCNATTCLSGPCICYVCGECIANKLPNTKQWCTLYFRWTKSSATSE